MKLRGKYIRILSFALIVTLCLNMVPFQVFATAEGSEGSESNTEPTGICEHHPHHTAECGYVEAMPETPCTYAPAEEQGSGETYRIDEDTAGRHQHDEQCGYVPATPGHPCQFVCPICSRAENRENAPYYLFIIHTLTYHDSQYGFSEVTRLTEEELAGGYDLGQRVLTKEGMTAAGISWFDPETGELEAAQTLSPDSFAEAGDPESGEGYLAAQAVIEYQVADGYRPVLQGDSGQPADPYGVMPLTSFEGGNIKDITFVPADVLTVRLRYKYSPTGGLAGMDAADSQVFQLKVDGVTRDDAGNVTAAGPLSKAWELPCYKGTLDSKALEGFRIVLDPAPLNAFVNEPELAAEAMAGRLSQAQIQQALEDDSFSVNVNNPDRPVYQWQVDRVAPPDTYEDYPINVEYGNRYSDAYNEAWNQARGSRNELYTAHAVQEGRGEPQGANPLNDPRLNLTMTGEQCAAALDSDEEITVTVYYRRNAGFYHVGHWAPRNGLSQADVNSYTARYPEYNQDSVAPYDKGYIMVYLERKQGRVGALTNARANPPAAEAILSSFIPRAVNQKIIEANTRVDILYDTADRYGLIFQTEDSYIPRQYVNKGYTVTFTTGSSSSSGMQVVDSSKAPVNEYVSYKNPTRQGYTFAGWKYEVRGDVNDPGVTEEGGRKYRTVAADSPWEISEAVVDEAVVVRDSDSGDAKMIYLYPVWTPDMANVRVVYWTEDLGGGSNDVLVTVDDTTGAAGYKARIGDAYQNGTPNTVGSSFSNVGSFTFMAPTNSILELSMNNGAFATTTTGTFTTTGEAAEYTDTLDKLIEKMFPVKMSAVPVSTGDSINTSKFYYPYGTSSSGGNWAAYTVAADGSTVINVYYARKVYKLDFTYYGEITKGSGTDYNGAAGLVVATNTIGYSVRDKSQITGTFDYDYQSSSSDNIHKNRWQLVDTTAPWTVPRTLAIAAKYDANLQEVWPVSGGEEIALNMPQTELDKQLKNVAVFMSWGATAGPFNQTYRDGQSNESTIIGNYRSMSADIIADPDNTATVHHLVGYWWNQNQSYYRRNACYEVPGLTAEVLLNAVGTGNADVKTFDLTSRTLEYDNNLTPPSELGTFGVVPIDVSPKEKERRDTVYLVPVSNSSLEAYFKDYDANFIRVNENGEPEEGGKFYAVRWINAVDDPNTGEANPQVYALGRQAMSVSNNYIMAQEPTDMPNMTKVKFAYTCENLEREVFVDHDSQAWDDWGRTAPGAEPYRFIALGTAEEPYDIWFYYKRARFKIHYLVASRNSTAGEYEIGEHETVYGQNMQRYNLKLEPEDARLYSNNERFKSQDYWKPAVNQNAMSGSASPANGLNGQGYTRLCPDSAVDGTGEWQCEYWSLDRSGSGIMADDDWNRIVTGNLRVFAQWTPPQYKVKFDFDGGSYNDSPTFPVQEVRANVGYTSSGKSIPSPTRDGFVFNGWTWYEAQPNGTDELTAGRQLDDFTFETPITRDMVLKAKWEPSAKTSYNYKIWYLTNDENAGSVDLPHVEGEWLTGNRGTPQPDALHQSYAHVLGCQYVGGQRLPEGTVLPLAAVAIPGYAPVEISTTLALDQSKNGTGAEDTENVAYFYYRKSQVKSYRVQFQLWDKAGDEGILTEFTTERVIADSTYFTPGEETWQRLRDAGYYLVQMNADGTAKTEGGGPIAARTYQDLSEFVNSEIQRFEAQPKGTNMTVTFKVAPYFYMIQYHVGTVKQGDRAITPGDTLVRHMQAALDNLAGEAVQAAVAAGKNPTRYVVADFNGGYGFRLNNPAAVRDPDDASKEWRFTGWSPAPGTRVISLSRSVAGEYPTLDIERSEGDLEFLANWELAERNTPSGGSDNPPVDPVDPEKPEKPPVDPEKPPVDPEKPEKPPVNPEKPPVDPVDPVDPEKPEGLPTTLPDPSTPDAPELITILENGVPMTYRKVWDPETETWLYILDEDVPLDNAVVPNTGDQGVFPWGLLGGLSLFGFVAILLQDRRKKKDSL